MSTSTLVERIHLLQIYRGLAAVVVVLFHATSELIDHHGFLAFGGVFSFGFSGVHVFFVLSGFVIALIHHKDVNQPFKLFPYAYKRIVRIYPVYWVVLLVPIINMFFGLDRDIHWPYIFQNITLLRITNHEPIVIVAWTLAHEIFFYAMFSLFLISAKVGALVNLIWFGLLAFVAYTGVEIIPPYFLSRLTLIDYSVFTNFVKLIFSPVNLLFGLGVFGYVIYRFVVASRLREQIASACLLLGVLIFSLSGIHWLSVTKVFNADWGWMYLYFGVATLFLIIATASERVGAWGERQRLLLFLGDASYSIYLVHFGVMMWIVRFYGPSLDINLNAYFLIISIVSIAAGIFFFLLVERPILIALGRRAKRKSDAATLSIQSEN